MRIYGLVLISALLVMPGMARNITFDDLYSFPGYEDIQISPDGKQIIYVIEENDLSENSRNSHIWIMDSDGSKPKKLTKGKFDQWNPRWSSDGQKIYFLSDREEHGSQIWWIPISGGESTELAFYSTGVSDFESTPYSNVLLFTSRVFPECHDDECNKLRLAEFLDNPIKAKLYDHLLYRHYYRWADDQVARLFLINPENRLYREMYSGPFDAPTSLLGGYGDYAISPDGEEVCFVMSVDSLPAVRVNNDLYVASSGGSDPVRITDNPALDTSPQYSPDGRYIAYHAMGRAGYESDQRDLVLYNRGTKEHFNLTSEFDRSIGQFVWEPNSGGLYFAAIEYGRQKIWHIDIGSKNVELILGDAVYGNLNLSPDGSFLIVTRSSSNEPSEIYKYDFEDQYLYRLTFQTSKLANKLDMRSAADFWFTGTMGDSVHGYLTLPPNFNTDEKYPLALLIHGGPQWCWLGNFNYYGWNTQLMAAQGYVVAQIDPHGSVGYGIKFKEYVSGNWGKGDFADLMKGVDYLVENYRFIDSTRMAALGRSYGGFMINWICGHTDRFKCLVSIDGTYNHISGYGSTEELWFPEWEYKGTPYDNRDEYVRSSPVTYARNFKTPTMVIHGQRDYRVDLSEGLQMFTALQRMGVPSQLLYFPDEGHSVRKLINLRYVYEKQFEWLERWLIP